MGKINWCRYGESCFFMLVCFRLPEYSFEILLFKLYWYHIDYFQFSSYNMLHRFNSISEIFQSSSNSNCIHCVRNSSWWHFRLHRCLATKRAPKQINFGHKSEKNVLHFQKSFKSNGYNLKHNNGCILRQFHPSSFTYQSFWNICWLHCPLQLSSCCYVLPISCCLLWRQFIA